MIVFKVCEATGALLDLGKRSCDVAHLEALILTRFHAEKSNALEGSHC